MSEGEQTLPPNVPDLVPARMLNEFAYCPRLAYLEWVQGDFTDSACAASTSRPLGNAATLKRRT